MTEEKAYALYDAIAKKVYAESNMMPGASALLNELKREGIPMAIGSSSTDYWIQLCLDAHDLHDYFDLTYSAASMNLPGKPDPSVYVKLMQDLGVDPTCSIVFEDSPTGFAAAVASGGVPVAIADPRWCDGPYPEAALEATSFENITLDRLNNLLTPHY